MSRNIIYLILFQLVSSSSIFTGNSPSRKKENIHTSSEEKKTEVQGQACEQKNDNSAESQSSIEAPKISLKIENDEIFINDNKVSFFEAIEFIYSKEMCELFVIKKETSISENIRQIMDNINFCFEHDNCSKKFEATINILNLHERNLEASTFETKEHKFIKRLIDEIWQYQIFCFEMLMP